MEGSGLERVLESPVYIRAWLGGGGESPEESAVYCPVLGADISAHAPVRRTQQSAWRGWAEDTGPLTRGPDGRSGFGQKGGGWKRPPAALGAVAVGLLGG